MKLKDSINITFHNIKNGKSRALITIVVTAILSFLTISFLSSVVSFRDNSNVILNRSFFQRGYATSIVYDNKQVDYQNNKDPLFSDIKVSDVLTYSKYLDVRETISNNNNAYSNIIYNLNNKVVGVDDINPIVDFVDLLIANIKLIEPNKSFDDFYTITEGTNLSDSYVKGGVIISEDYKNALSKREEIDISVGSKIPVTYCLEYLEHSSSGGGHYFKAVTISSEVIGIFSSKNKHLRIGSEDMLFLNDNVDVISTPINYLGENNHIYIEGFNALYETEKDVDINKYLKTLNTFVGELNSKLPKKIVKEGTAVTSSYYESPSVDSNFIEIYDQINRYNSIYTTLALVVGFILALVTTFSLVNTMSISYRKNRKTYGLYKALGIKPSSMNFIIIFESLFLVLIGVLLGYALCWIMKPVLEILLYSILNSFLDTYIASITFVITFNVPAYSIPIIVGIYSILLFAMSHNMRKKILKSDAIELINEAK